MQDVVIVAAGRTAMGSFNGSLAKVSAVELGAAVVQHVVKQARLDPGLVQQVVLGQVLTAGAGQNPARQTTLRAGLPADVPAYTINKVCGSGLMAVMLAAQAIRAEDADIVLAGGQENMSQAPHVLPGLRDGYRMGEARLIDSILADGLTDALGGYHMGITAENVAKEYGISREDQDAFALQSQHKAERAQSQQRFAEEIVPIAVPQKKGEPLLFARDEFPRAGATLDSLSKLRPAFAKDGTVTAGNASGINDGAAALLLMSARRADELRLQPLAMVRAYASAGLDPAMMGMGPVPAAQTCLRRAGWRAADLDLLEINEAFAAQAVAVNRAMGWDPARVNVNGGAIALGHPIGASGARILVTLLAEMKKRDAKRGLSALCIGGGMGVALAVERF